MKTLILSDAHLGAGTDSIERERELCRLIDSQREGLDQLILLGDMFDFWFTFKRVVPRGFTRFIGRLADLADQGVEIHYYIGNHDMWLFDYPKEEFLAKMHSEPDMLEVQGLKLCLGHGDGLGHLDHKYDFIKMVFRCKFCQWLFSMVPSRFSFWIANGWSGSSRKSHPYEEQQYLGDDREGIVLWCKQQMTKGVVPDAFIFGHRHTPIDMTIHAANGSSARYLNAGDFISHRSYIIIEDCNITLHQ